MKKLLIITFILLSGVLKVQSQNLRLEAPPGYNFIYEEKDLPMGTEGSPYLDDWQHAQIVFKNGDVIPDLMVRYNELTNQMLYQDKNKTYIIGAPNNIARIDLPGKVFSYGEFLKGNKMDRGYYQVLEAGKMNLLVKYEIEMKRSNYNVALDIGEKTNKLLLHESLCLQMDDRILPLQKKSKPLDFFSGKEKEISEYMNREKLSFSKKEDLKKAVAFYNGKS
jgi:hypothetical protein